MNHFYKKILSALVFAAIIIGAAVQQLRAQTFKLIPEKDATIKVLGSSNVHDWTLVSSSMESQGEFKIEENQLRSIAAFTFSLNAKSLKSEHESMDGRTYKTMKADQYPKVTYKLTSATINAASKNKYQVKATGDLAIAGVTQTIVMNILATVNPDNTITVTGSENLKLTDFKIEPPRFMLGAMKVKNDLTIQFNLTYKNNQLLTKTL
ncbi:YceI family protein [Mucilaginibacter mali]|uniref:YceI family protein n=1 Tax=Mucilaginibacter mali TaxID=2740462 RepID=A0A7D4UDY5_9SPHI|nr:YceI family protein [Mucilaginibacter mali]QKJ32958.1 YceI family protein [Mucilaginibacter mali]